jgi:hypothetical protein
MNHEEINDFKIPSALTPIFVDTLVSTYPKMRNN